VSFLNNLQIAVDGIITNKMRSALTMLGIIIGVAAVIIMISLGQGASKQIADQISSMGSNLLMVMPGATMGPVKGSGGSRESLTLDDCYAIGKLDMVSGVAPQVGTSGTIAYGSETWTTDANGTTADMQTVKNIGVSDGAFISADDISNSAMAAVLGKTVVDNLFPSTEPVGKIFTINKLAFTVVGVLSSQGASIGGQDQDDVIYIPVTTAQQRFSGSKSVDMIYVKTKTADSMDYVQSSIETLLRTRHRLTGTSSDDFNVRNLATVLAASQSSTTTMSWLLAGVAAVSLLVGGIGIMNIMLVSVTERTREIGLRMAVGATANDIRKQFVVEALVLCLLGGLMGIIIGYAGSRIISSLAGWVTYVTPLSVLISAGFSALIGIFFGYYPADKAARLNPIEALRYE